MSELLLFVVLAPSSFVIWSFVICRHLAFGVWRLAFGHFVIESPLFFSFFFGDFLVFEIG